VLRSQPNRIGGGSYLWMPAFEVMTWLLIEHAGSYLEQPMCTGHRPSHLLLLDEPLADDLKKQDAMAV
jgi:hypothetical protein